MPLPRNCKKCDQRFQPIGKKQYWCKKCRYNILEDNRTWQGKSSSVFKHREKMKSDKKGEGGGVIAIIAVLLVIVGIVVLVVVLNQKGFGTTINPEENITKIKFIISAKDTNTRESVGSNYVLYDSNETIVSEGYLEGGELREILVIPGTHQLVCYSESYYLVKAFKQISDADVELGVVEFSCDMEKIEKNLKIKHTGEIKGELSQITLNMTAEDKFQKVVVCSAWTSGISKVEIPESFITCETGIWKNYTAYNETTQVYDSIPEGEYICGDRVEICQVAQGSSCKPPEQEIPNHLLTKVDSCTYLGRSIKGISDELIVTVKKSDFATRNDYVLFYIMDQDRRWSPEDNLYKYFIQLNGGDVGAETLTYEIGAEI